MSTGNRNTTAASQPKLSKNARLEAMLRRPKGAPQKQLETGLGWQSHRVRAAISRLRKEGTDLLLDCSAKTPAYRIAAYL